jgi:transcriptional regulator with XRE-family HTH domain
MFPSRSHPVRGRDRSRVLARRFGQELRIARVTAGLTQRQLARLAGTTQQEVSRVERGNPGVRLDVRCRLASGCGHELWWRLDPVESVRLRDSGQLRIAEAILRALHPAWAGSLEVPVARDDRRAADMVLAHAFELVEVEIERSLVDFQAQLRAAQLKRRSLAEREVRPVRLIIAVPDTTATRARIRPHLDVISQALPASSRSIRAALRAGEPIGSDGLLFVRPRSP